MCRSKFIQPISEVIPISIFCSTGKIVQIRHNHPFTSIRVFLYSASVGHSRFGGEGISGILTRQQGQASCFLQKSPHLRVVFFRESLQSLIPTPLIATETKTTDATRRRIKKMSDKRVADSSVETQLPQFSDPHK